MENKKNAQNVRFFLGLLKRIPFTFTKVGSSCFIPRYNSMKDPWIPR